MLGLAALVPAGPAEAIRHPNHFFFFESLDDRWFFGGDEDFLVVTVLAVRDSGSTNSQPPDLTVRIEEVLRGRLEQGSRTIGWPPVPMFLPCAVGEGENIRRWRNTPLPGPAVGRRMILGGHMTAEGLWLSDAMLRWDDDGSARADEVRRKIREWGPSAAARQRREAKGREEQARRERAERMRLEAERALAERAWLETERAIREESDVAALVRQSDAIFVASPPRPERPGGAWRRTMDAFQWMLEPRVSSASPSVVWFGREAPRDSVVRRWLGSPVDDGPGVQSGDSIRCIVFVRTSHEPRPDKTAPFFRPVDPIRGMLLADSAVVRAVREAVARRGDAPAEPPTACGASLLEFAGADTLEAAGIALKLTAFPPNNGSVVLACGPVGSHSGFTAVHAGTFPPCAGSNRLAADDHEGALQLLVGPRVMSALLDSLATLPRLLAGTFEPKDAVTLSLHRVVAGRPRVYDATLDSTSARAVNRFLAALLTEQGVARWNLPRFWGGVDPRLLAAWQEPPRVPAPAPPPRPAPVPFAEASGHESAILGMIVDEVSREPLRGFMIHTTRPRRVVETSRDGIFALTRLNAGPRGMLVYGPGHAPSYAEVDLRKGQVQLLVLRVLREGAPPSSTSPRLRRRAPTPFHLPSLWTRLVVEVRDAGGRPLANAHVRLDREGQVAAGFTDAGGRKSFGELPQGPVHLLVQAPGHGTYKGKAEVRSHLPQTFEVTLPSSF